MKIFKISLLLAFSALLLVACGDTKSEDTKNETAVADTIAKKPINPVKTMSITKDTISNELSYTSTLIAFEELNYAPASPGRIEKIYVEVGDKVRKGQKLVSMDKTQLVQSRIQLQQLEIDYKRMQQLRETNTVSQQQFDQVKMQYDVAKSSIKFLEDNTELTAPFSGIITGKYYEDLELYSGAPNTQAGKAAVVSLMQINPVKAIVGVSEKYFPNVKTGMTVKLFVEAFPDEEFLGEVYRIHPTINSATRTFNVEVKIKNTDERLRPGMYSKVYINLGEVQAFMVPAVAVLQQQGTNNRYVYLHKNGKAQRVSITLGRRFNDKLEIIAPEIQEGKQLIVSGQKRLLNNVDVTIVKEYFLNNKTPNYEYI